MKKRIMCFGDSNVWGLNPQTSERYDEDTRWTGVLQNLLGSDYTVLEEGLSGRTTAFGGDYDKWHCGVDSLGFVLKTVMPIDAVVISLGSNDIWDRDVYRSAKGLAEVIRQVKYANTVFRASSKIFPKDPKILVICPTPFGKTCKAPEHVIEESKLFPKYYKPVCEQMKVDFMDPTNLAKPSEIDGIHYTAESHKLLGKAVFDKLKEMQF